MINKVSRQDFLQLQTDLRFDVAIIDPPYNIGKDFGNESDKQALADYLEWMDAVIAKALGLLHDGGLAYVYGFSEILAHVSVRLPA